LLAREALAPDQRRGTRDESRRSQAWNLKSAVTAR